jgi:hypothetical protein
MYMKYEEKSSFTVPSDHPPATSPPQRRMVESEFHQIVDLIVARYQLHALHELTPYIGS